MSMKKLVLGSLLMSSLNAKALAFCINWLNYHEIRHKVKKYNKENESSCKFTIEEDVLFLLFQFSASKIKLAFAITLSNLDVSFPGLDQFPLRTNKLIERVSQLIYDHMLIFGHSLKSAKRYVL
jgi:hypothetical protein